jgi:hypothetical protein
MINFATYITVMDIQLLLVFLIGAVAVFYMVRRIRLQLNGKKKAGCEKCAK